MTLPARSAPLQTAGDRVRSHPVLRIAPARASQLRAGAALVALLATLAAGAWIAPRGVMSITLLRAQDDPVELAELRLPAVATHDRIAREIDEALQQGDADLAISFLDLAEARHVAVEPEQRKRVEAAAGATAKTGAGDFATGFASGQSTSWIGSAGVLASDLVGVGDLRDLWQEGNKLYAGEPYDLFVLGLSAAGVGLTGVTLATVIPSAGGSMAAKAPVTKGLSLLKTARKAGMLSRELVERLTGMMRAVIDPAALKGAVTAARGLDMAGAKRAALAAIRPEGVRALERLGADTIALEARLGPRGAAQALNMAHDGAELSQVRRLAQAMGQRTRAVLKLLGPAAFLLGSIIAALLQAVWLAVAWAFTASLFARRLGMTAGRLIWGWRRPRRMVLAGGTPA